MKTKYSLNEIFMIALFGIGCWGCSGTSNGGGSGGGSSSGGATGGGGATAAGGQTNSGGSTDSGGATGAGGAAGAGGSTVPATKLPCDVLADDGGPCVAAHSTVRLLSSTYSGPLYQVRVGGSSSGTGGATTDIEAGADGFADGAAQTTACGSSACTISIIYDQSGKGNHLTHAPAGGNKVSPDLEANAKALPVTISGHNVFGVHNVVGVGYRNNAATGTATGDNAQTAYMVAAVTTNGAAAYNGGCCFDYGNAETNSRDNGEGTMEAVYFGTCTTWNEGGGAGPWVMGDLENGLWAGNYTPYGPNGSIPTTWKFVMGMVKGDAAGKNHWTIKVGNAQAGGLAMPFDGPRPSSRYNPMRLEGAIILGTGGDNSNGGKGDFFEGVMTANYSSNSADDAIQANIVYVYGQ
jgi:hypothetical protein